MQFTLYFSKLYYVQLIKKFVFKSNKLNSSFLNLIIECNKTTVDDLDIALNLLDETYTPYQKPENTLQYIHKESNHPASIIKQILITIETPLSNHLSNETVFRHAEKIRKALKKSGHNVPLQCKPTDFKEQNKSQKKHYLAQSFV